jgi:hypothetical protein
VHEDLDERGVVADIWRAYQRGDVVTKLVSAAEVGDAITALKWAGKLAGLLHGAEIAGFDRREVLVWEPPYPRELSRFGDDPSRRLLMLRPRSPAP